MAGWNGTGVFTRLYSWVADANAGINILASRVDADTDNITTNGFNNCLTRDGQGTATANLPMNGFRHVNASDATGIQDYATLNQLYGNNVPGRRTLAQFGDVKDTALPESLLPTFNPGWYVCAGQTRPRTDPLWVLTGAVSPGNWVWGNGDGSTTYTLPDFRGRARIGKDDMNGSAANRVTNGVSGVAGATLGASGGNQALQLHGHSATSTDSGHLHTAGGSDSGHTHAITDSGHTHSVALQTNGGGAANGTATSIGGAGATAETTGNSGTGITVNSGNAVIAVTVDSSTANVTTAVGNSGSGGSENIPPVAVVNTIIFCGA